MARIRQPVSGHSTEASADAGVAAVRPVGIEALVRGLRVVEMVADCGKPVGVGELSRELGLPKSTVQRLLVTLEQEGWTARSSEPVTRWSLGPKLATIVGVGRPTRDLRQTAAPHLEALGRRSGETIHFSVPDGDTRLILIDRVDSIHPVRTFNAIGAGTDFHASASGKAFLSRLPDEEVDIILARSLDHPTPATITDPERLTRQVLEARERGYAVNLAENRLHVCAVAAAVVGTGGRPVAAVAISMPDIRFEPARVPEWGEWVKSTAEAISQEIVDG